MYALFDYTQRILYARYFWTHLALADLRAKYRGSIIGLGWSILQPLTMTLLLAFVMGNIMHAAMREYAPFVFSGLILWEFINGSALAGCNAFMNASGYIKQFTHPLAIYSLRGVLAALINLWLAFLGLIVWVFIIEPQNFGLSWLSLPLAFILLFFLVWPLATVTAFIGARFRDFQQLLVIFMQALSFMSPVFFQPSVFLTSKIDFLVADNPVYHVLQLFRAPLLSGQWPTSRNYLFTITTIFCLWFIAIVLVSRSERKQIFYL